MFLRRHTTDVIMKKGFEDSFVIPVSDSQAYKQFGNAVTVNVSRAVAQSVKSTFINLGEWVD